MAEVKINKRVKYPFASLEIGDTYAVKCFQKDAKIVKRRLISAAMMYKRKYNKLASFKTSFVVGAVIIERV